MSASSFDFAAYQFMRREAGYSYRPSIETEGQGAVRSALALARAEHALHESGAWVAWEPDPDGDANGEHPAWCAVLYHPDDIHPGMLPVSRAALGGIDAPEGNPYRRVVEAELALEAGICHPLDRQFIPAID